MTFLLSTKNVFDYLLEQKICESERQNLSKPELKPAKNFNLLLTVQDKCKLLIKQERPNRIGKTSGEFLNEWRIHELFQQFSELHFIRSSLSEVIHFDPNNSIIVFNYLADYRDLTDFYVKDNVFPISIPTAIGKILATIHRITIDCQEYRDFLTQNREDTPFINKFGNLQDLERIGPEIFGSVPGDGLKFFALYQRYDSLGQAIAELISNLEPCCLTHNDLKLNNILLDNNWELVSKTELSEGSLIRLIDWERAAWGDPALDLGMLIASYLQIWLSSLVVSKDVAIEESLRLAITPLELLQPAIAALTSSYFGNFPEILERRPNFLRQVLQCAGLALIQQIQAMIQYQKSFGNMGVCILQVAKTLLCRPEKLIPTIFGVAESELICLDRSLI